MGRQSHVSFLLTQQARAIGGLTHGSAPVKRGPPDAWRVGTGRRGGSFMQTKRVSRPDWACKMRQAVAIGYRVRHGAWGMIIPEPWEQLELPAERSRARRMPGTGWWWGNPSAARSWPSPAGVLHVCWVSLHLDWVMAGQEAAPRAQAVLHVPAGQRLHTSRVGSCMMGCRLWLQCGPVDKVGCGSCPKPGGQRVLLRTLLPLHQMEMELTAAEQSTGWGRPQAPMNVNLLLPRAMEQGWQTTASASPVAGIYSCG